MSKEEFSEKLAEEVAAKLNDRNDPKIAAMRFIRDLDWLSNDLFSDRLGWRLGVPSQSCVCVRGHTGDLAANSPARHV